ncbi:MAG: hypothetical protein ACXVEE_38225 [Polyangiales bacterium]
MAYREATITKRPFAVVDYRPMSLFWAVSLVCFILALSAFMVFQALTLARTSHLDCSREGLHACVLVREYGPVATRETYPLDAIQSVAIKGHSGKGGSTYSVDLAMRDGTRTQLSRAGSRHLAEVTLKEISDFLDGRAASPSKIPIDDPSPILALMMGLFSIAIGAFSFLILGSARLEFDFDGDKIHYTRRRFPLRPERRTLRGEDVQCARVTARPGSKGGTIYGIALDLEGGASLALLRGGSSNKARHYDAANEINTLLAKLREQRAG